MIQCSEMEVGGRGGLREGVWLHQSAHSCGSILLRRTGDREDSDAEYTLLRGGRDQVHRFLMSMQRK